MDVKNKDGKEYSFPKQAINFWTSLPSPFIIVFILLFLNWFILIWKVFALINLNCFLYQSTCLFYFSIINSWLSVLSFLFLFDSTFLINFFPILYYLFWILIFFIASLSNFINEFSFFHSTTLLSIPLIFLEKFLNNL
jgi:hypothetical protein